MHFQVLIFLKDAKHVLIHSFLNSKFFFFLKMHWICQFMKRNDIEPLKILLKTKIVNWKYLLIFCLVGGWEHKKVMFSSFMWGKHFYWMFSMHIFTNDFSVLELNLKKWSDIILRYLWSSMKSSRNFMIQNVFCKEKIWWNDFLICVKVDQFGASCHG